MWYLDDTEITLDRGDVFLDGSIIDLSVSFWSRLWTTIFPGTKTLRGTLMKANALYVGDTKKLFFATDEDLSGAASIKVYLRSPSGVVKTFDGVADQGPDPDGNLIWGIYYITQATDIDEAGRWEAHTWSNLHGFSNIEEIYALSPLKP